MTKVGIVGVTGYTGMELARLLLRHPGVRLAFASSRQWAGKPLAAALPALAGACDLTVSAFEPEKASREADLFFLCLPHGGAMAAAAALHGLGRKVVDLSADLRLSDPALFARWYGTEHRHPDLLREAVNGFPELDRKRIAGAALVANPGCYPTSVVLGLAPLVERGLVRPDSVIADSKSGVSGAGREPAPHLHFPEVEGNFSAYKLAGTHRHTAEMEQELSRLAGAPVTVSFSPHLLPVSRGILSTLYASPSGAVLAEEDLAELYLRRYADEPFVRVRGPKDPLPSLKEVRGTNLCVIAPRVDARAGRYVIVACLDNLVKGASGQAVQNMNLMLGSRETDGLDGLPQWP